MNTLKSKLFLMATILTVLLTVSSCRKDKEDNTVIKPNYSNLIIGTWVCDNVEGTENITNDKFVCQFNADKTEMYANGYTLGDSSIWLEKTGFTYNLNETILTIEGSSVFDNQLNMEIELTPLNENTIKFKDKKIVIDGIESDTLYTYTMKKVTEDNSDKLLGLWKGHELIGDTIPVNDNYWEFLDNGHYNYYFIMDETGHYMNDTTGYYLCYGNLIVFNFFKITEGVYKYDCMDSEINGDTLTFCRKMADGIEKTYELVRTNIYPE